MAAAEAAPLELGAAEADAKSRGVLNIICVSG